MRRLLPIARPELLALLVAISLTLISIWLHVENFKHAGALWRDEVNTVELAMETRFSSIYSNLHFDSFPLAWVSILRGYIGLGNSTDAALRALGLVVGALSLVILWLNARLFPNRYPLLSLLLLGVNAAIIRYGDALRAYGLGILTGLMMFGAVWNLTRRRDLPAIVLALFTSLLAVHSLFYNAVFLFGCCMGAVAVMIRRRDTRGIGLFLGIGGICAASLFVYLPMIQGNREWSDLVRYSVGVPWFWQRWGEALIMSGESMRFLWTMLFAAAMLVGIGALRGRDVPAGVKEPALFCVTTLVIGTLAYVVFLRSLNYLTEPWYYLSLMVIIASCVDPLLGLVAPRKHKILIAVSIILLAGVSLEPVLVVLRSPQSNIDLVAQKISRDASAEDLVLVFPWQTGISFQRYYKGPALWQTIPPVGFHRWHRYDLYKQAMAEPATMERLVAHINRHLDRGGRIWIAAPPAASEPAPRGQPEPRLTVDDQAWREHLEDVLDQIAPRIQQFRLGSVRGGLENLLLEVRSRQEFEPETRVESALRMAPP